MDNIPIIKTERLVLRKFSFKDINAFFDIMRDEEVNTYLPWFPLKLENVKAKLNGLLSIIFL